jgi:hypothetical protein
MNLQLKHLFAGLAFSLLSAASLHAQNELSSFTSTGRGVASPFVTDYHALGINPSNLNWASEYDGKKVTFGFAEIAASVYSEALVKEDLRKNIFGDDFEKLNRQEKIKMIQEFTDAGTAVDVSYMWAGAAFNSEKLGGFSYTTRDNIQFSSRLNEDLSTLMYLGGTAPYFEQLILSSGDTIANTEGLSQYTLDMVQQGYTSLANAKSLSEIIGDSEISLSWVREYHFGYGKRIVDNDNIQLFVGVGAKYIVGQGLARVGTNADGEIEAFSALAPVFGIDYGDGGDINPSSLPEGARRFEPVGQGYGFDVGVSAIIKEKLYLALSITDFGRMKWDGNAYTLEDFKVTDLTDQGVDSNSIVEQISTFTDPDGLLAWTGETELKTKLPAKARVGARLDVHDKVRVGVEGVFAVNQEIGQLEKPIISIGGDFTPMPWIRLSAGVINGGNYDLKVPAGLTLIVAKGSWEIGIASRDMITFFSKNQPTLSASFGFLRFRV